MINCEHIYLRRERVINTQKLEAMIRGLQPSTTYQFHVVAQNVRGASAPSEVLQVVTLIEVKRHAMILARLSFPYFFIYDTFSRVIAGKRSGTSDESGRSRDKQHEHHLVVGRTANRYRPDI